MVGCFSNVGSGKKLRFEHVNADDAEGEERPFLLPPQLPSGEEPSSSFESILDTERDPVAPNDASVPHTSCKAFMFRELAEATKNFRSGSFLGEGGFGKVYRGFLKSTGQVVAVKQLNRDGFQGEKEFLVEVLMLSQLQHPNLVNLIGFCRDGDERLLVYEYMPLGSLADHLHGFHHDKQPLDWNTRMKIAAGAAKGLKHLHHDNTPPVIFRDFKSANILLDKGFHPKLSDFGLAKYGPPPDKTHVSTRVMGTHGYCAPEYVMTGRITVRSDVYSFGVVLLELITGRRAFDDSRARDERHLVRWALPMLSDRKYLPKLADPKLRCRYSVRGLERALAVASRCIKEEAVQRPLIADVAIALAVLADEACNSSSAAPISGRRSCSRRDARPNRAVVAEQAGKVLAEDDYGGSKNTEIIGILSNTDCDRAQVVAKAKVWAETWREKRQDIG